MRLQSINTFGRGYTQESGKGYFRTVFAQEEKMDVDWSQGNVGLKFSKSFQLLEKFLSDSLPVQQIGPKHLLAKHEQFMEERIKWLFATVGRWVQYRAEGN